MATNTTRSRHSGRVVEQHVVHVEAAHDVLRQVDAVAAQHELAVTDELVELGGGGRGGVADAASSASASGSGPSGVA